MAQASIWLRRTALSVSLGGLLLGSLARAETAAFDLPGPSIEIKVTRAGKTLPVSEVPNLEPGDRIWLHPIMPTGQSVHFALIAAFLRGATNPPPDSWFTKAETRDKHVQEDGIFVTVPAEAQQMLLFLAPDTGGDFSTLRSTVRGKPGVFVRVCQVLEQASLDRGRLDTYLAQVSKLSAEDPKTLHDTSVLLAKSLSIKLDEKCFDRPTEQQAACLAQGTDKLVLDGGQSQTMVAALTSGSSADLISQLSNTPRAGGGAYSSYVGAIVDVVRIMDSFHTAKYQYIPALAVPQQDAVQLKLNTPPSFHDPKSVLVIGMPAVAITTPPLLRQAEPKQVLCATNDSLTLPVDGDPLIYSTGFAHDLTLQIQNTKGQSISLPITADAAKNGFIVDTHPLPSSGLGAAFNGTIRGFWGTQPFDGPSYHLRLAHAAKWTMPAADQSAMVVGRLDRLHLMADEAVCVDDITLKQPGGKLVKTVWKLTKPDELEVEVPLQDAGPGDITMLVKQSGVAAPDEVLLHTYAEAARLDEFLIHSGDQQGILQGTRLDEVSGVELAGAHFTVTKLKRVNGKDQLSLSTTGTVALQPGQTLKAHVTLTDGRELDVPVTVEEPRPLILLISKAVQQDGTATHSGIHLVNQDDLPQNSRLSFFLKTKSPASFPRTESIEVANEDDTLHALLSVEKGDVTLQDAATVLAVLDPSKQFGPSGFGALRFRPVDASGAQGDWQHLATLVRLPALKEVRCPDAPAQPCTLSGTNLFLIDSVSATPQFTDAVSVPVGSSLSSLQVPRPNGTLLYLKLRDDPSTINTLVLPVIPE